MIGKRRYFELRRITCIVSYPSMPGIMISIRTIETAEELSSMAMASWPVADLTPSRIWYFFEQTRWCLAIRPTYVETASSSVHV
jgi:hypothetical protein